MECLCLHCCLSEADRIQLEQNRRIEQAIKKSKREEKKQIKLLLLGTGESGKSTFIRQMRIIYDKGYCLEDKLFYVKLILQNILNSMQTMIGAMDLLRIPYQYEMNVRNAELVKTANYEAFISLTDMYLSALKELWNDAGIQECYMRRREYQLTDSVKYYLSHIDRIATSEYLPTEEDILHVRVPTTGLVEYNFNVKNIEFRMIDVGGQRSERKKWMNCFNDVKAIIFLVAISEYDQYLQECDKSNRLIESKNVFSSISNYEWFNNTSIVLFLNKIDLLKEKIMYSDLATFFPDYTGPKQDYLAAREFIAQIFEKLMPSRRLYKHFTCATDTANIKVVFAVVRDTILNEHLNRFGLF